MGVSISLIQSILSLFGSKISSVQFGTSEPIQVEKGTSILQVALDNNIDLEHFCGGSCSCSTCRVEVLKGGQNLSKIQPNEADVLGAKRVAKGDRLSCQAKVNGEVQVRIPDLF